MKNNILKHILLWITIAVILVVYYGRVNSDFMEAFYYVTMLMPVAVGTAYVFNYYLVPNYLLTKRYWMFSLYMFYMVVITLYLEMMVMVFSFIYMYNFRFGDMNPLTVDTLSVATTIYLIVFGFAFFRMIESLRQVDSEKALLRERLEKDQQQILTVVSDRHQVPIVMDNIRFIESLADYVMIHQVDGKTMTKEKISVLEESLPSNFIRIHRSFIVNKRWITAFNSEHVVMIDEKIPVSRTYKKKALEELEG
ncbi:MAG: LytR/AlgR family response regulator transcription factor [Bacteroidota bacterium]